MPTYYIESLADPRLDPYRQFKRHNSTLWAGQLVAEGDKLTPRLIVLSRRDGAAVTGKRVAMELGAGDVV
jgi:hypothetical protein